MGNEQINPDNTPIVEDTLKTIMSNMVVPGIREKLEAKKNCKIPSFPDRLVTLQDDLFTSVEKNDINSFTNVLKKIEDFFSKSNLVLRKDKKQLQHFKETFLNSPVYVSDWIKNNQFFSANSSALFNLLCFVCFHGRENMFKILQNRSDIKLFISFEHELSPFMFALMGRKVLKGNYMYNELLKLYTSSSKPIYWKNMLSDLSLSVYFGDYDIFCDILKSPRYTKGSQAVEKALIIACGIEKRIEFIKKLAKIKGIFVLDTVTGLMPLSAAAILGNMEYIKLLLTFEGVFYALIMGEGGTKNSFPLRIAVNKGRTDIALLLLNQKDFSKRDLVYGETGMEWRRNPFEVVLFKATLLKQKEVIEKILEVFKTNNANMNTMLIYPIMYLCEIGDLEMLKFFFKHCYDRININWTVNHFCRYEKFEISSEETKKKHDKQKQSGIEIDPLLVAFLCNQMEVVKYLLELKEINLSQIIKKTFPLNNKYSYFKRFNFRDDHFMMLVDHPKFLKYITPEKLLMNFIGVSGKSDLLKRILAHEKFKDVVFTMNYKNPINFLKGYSDVETMRILLKMKKSKKITCNWNDFLQKAFQNCVLVVVKEILDSLIKENAISEVKSDHILSSLSNSSDVTLYLLENVDLKMSEKLLYEVFVKNNEMVLQKILDMNKKMEFDDKTLDLLYNAFFEGAKKCYNFGDKRYWECGACYIRSNISTLKLNANMKELWELACRASDIKVIYELINHHTFKYSDDLIEFIKTFFIGIKKSEDMLKLYNLLVEKNINVDKLNDVIFKHACESGCVELVKVFLKKKDFIFPESDSENIPYLGILCLRGKLEIVKLLFEKFPKYKKENINFINKKILSNYSYGHERNFVGSKPPFYSACLNLKAKNNNYEMAKFFLAQVEFDINSLSFVKTRKGYRETMIGMSFLSIACQRELIDIIKIFVERKDLKPNIGDVTVHPFCIDYKEKEKEIYKILIKNKDIDVNVEKNVVKRVNKRNISQKKTRLHHFLEENDIEMFELFLKHPKIDVNKGDFPVLLHACKLGRTKFVKMLLKRDDINLIKGKLCSPLSEAIKHGHTEIVNLLIDDKRLVIEEHGWKSSFGDFYTFKKLLKIIPDTKKGLLNSALQHFCMNSMEDELILLLQRNIKFSLSEIKLLIKSKEINEIIVEFLSNRSKFRCKYKKFKEYDIGIDVREFVRCAFVVGNGDYEHLDKLKTPTNDAKEIYSLLKNSLGFEYVKKVNDCDVDDLFDDFDVFFHRLVEISNKEEHENKTFLIFFFYAGHGVTFESESFMLPIDFKHKFFLKKKMIYERAFSLKKLNNMLSNFAKESVSIIVLDACRTNVDKGKILEMIENKELSESLKGNEIENLNIKTRGDGKITKKTKNNYIYCFATDPSAVALDSSVIKEKKDSLNSPFTISLIENLQEQGNFENILKKVRNRTMELTAMNQKPWTNSSLSFPVMWNDDVESGQSFDKNKEESKEKSIFLASRLLFNKMKQKRTEDDFTQLKMSFEKLEKEFLHKEKEIVHLKRELKKKDNEIMILKKKITTISGNEAKSLMC